MLFFNINVQKFTKTSMYPVLIISYEMFVRMFDLLQTLTFDLIVCDEGHRLKNTTIKTTSVSLLCVQHTNLFVLIIVFFSPGVYYKEMYFYYRSACK